MSLLKNSLDFLREMSSILTILFGVKIFFLKKNVARNVAKRDFLMGFQTLARLSSKSSFPQRPSQNKSPLQSL